MSRAGAGAGAGATNAAERSMGLGLRVLNRLAGSELLDRTGQRRRVERLVFRGARGGFRAAGATSRGFSAASRLARPARQAPARAPELFDVRPDEEQRLLRESIGAFATEKLRPAALAADAAGAAPARLLAQANELGMAMLGVPEELGGVISQRSAVTGVLAAEALAHGDMGIALAALAPGAVASALGLWGDAEQQSTYLPSFTGADPPAAALAILEPRALFDPFKLATRARRREGDWVLSGAKTLVPRACEDELLVVAADAEGLGPALFLLESSTRGVFSEREPAMGVRAAATGRLVLEDARVPAAALLAGGSGEVYGECVQRARIAWCALAVGVAQAALDYLVPYVNERVAFGEPISNRQAVAFALADVGIELEGMRLLTYRAASRADMGKSFAREAALARRLCARQGARIGSEAVQLLGGHGYVKEHPVERWYRDLRAVGVIEGALLV
ncbi:MAG TPA: acyl-CoA dehydrogenase family protein [Solirubrobacteraceae bacterium]|nr:acyl-CoA dehydrogenase family protein [Solirubrobacteraceae bacterium]